MYMPLSYISESIITNHDGSGVLLLLLSVQVMIHINYLLPFREKGKGLYLGFLEYGARHWKVKQSMYA